MTSPGQIIILHHHNLRATFLDKDSTIVLTDSIVYTLHTFSDNLPGIIVVLGDHITIHIVATQKFLSSVICGFQTHTNLTINTEFTDRVFRENEKSEERHLIEVVCGGLLSPPLNPLWSITRQNTSEGCADFWIGFQSC